MDKGLSESRFNMWRAVVAVIHADEIVKPHEINFIIESTRDLPLTTAQRETLKQDIYAPAEMRGLFEKITSPQDKEDFFHLARAAAWADGDFDAREETLLNRMGKINVPFQDINLLRNSSKSFNDIYVMENRPVNDDGLFAIIRRLMGRDT